jgi:hypothetical protein
MATLATPGPVGARLGALADRQFKYLVIHTKKPEEFSHFQPRNPFHVAAPRDKQIRPFPPSAGSSVRQGCDMRSAPRD